MDENNISIFQKIWIPGKHTVKCNSCSWSQNDRFFVLTEFGIEIFILVPQPNSKNKELDFKRSFISHDQDKNSKVSDRKFDELYNRDTLLERLLEREKSLPFISKDENFDNRVVSASWAPISLLPNLSPPLTVLTVSGNLTIRSTDQITKYPTFNVTEIFSTGDRESKLTASMAWFEAEDTETNENKYFLVCGQLSGTVQLLEASATPSMELQFKLIREVLSVNSRSTIIKYISGSNNLILVGTLNGNLYAASPHKDKPALTLWPDEDNIQITTITSLDHDDATYVFITKLTYLILIKISDNKLISEPKIIKTESLPFVAATKMNGIILFQTLGSDLFYVEKDTVETFKWPSDLWRYQAANGLCFTPSGAIGVVFATNTCSRKKKMNFSSSNLILFHLPISFIDEGNSPMQGWDKLELRRILLLNNKHSYDQLNCLIDKSFSNLQLKLWTEQNDDKEEVEDIFGKILKNHLVESLNAALEHCNQWSAENKELIRQQYRFVLKSEDSKSEYLKTLQKIEKKLGQVAKKPARQCLWCDENFDGILCSNKHPRQWCFISLRDILSESLSCPFCHATVDINVHPLPKLCIFCNNRLIQTRYLSNKT